ncbi:choline monooxygenase, chloroplastic-like isoform X2 [Papaver somniferum]|uniref:choline monooxygenase, chloroplastic-like isoform X2 n=1 Tax=Papaver somniferum TaxID=3469 RepID=UPI000E7010BB|nr:choline monooxygenase, chloroplastic-like isoform X2 [Papaver somniferum]
MAILKPILLGLRLPHPLEVEAPKLQIKSSKKNNSLCHHNHRKCLPKRSMIICNSLSADDTRTQKLVKEFNPEIPIEKAITPPSSWYTDSSFLSLEFDRVFHRGWQAVGYTEQIKNPRDFFTGRLGSVQFVICRDTDGKIQAFHNVCRHHASLLASGSGQKSCFVCPYHGWTYGLDGALLKAARITGIQDFNVDEFGLKALQVATWGPFVLINLSENILQPQLIANKTVGSEWLGNCSEIFSANGVDSSLSYVARREYTIECNGKVFCDNYLDGGYHVPYAHTGLASGLKLDAYTTTIFDKVSIQACESSTYQQQGGGDDFDRLGSKAFYAFVYPNFMINRMTRFSSVKV